MEKEKIGIDIDEVIVEFMSGYLVFHNKKYKTNYNLNDITNYHLWIAGLHKTKEESVEDVNEFSNSIHFNSLLLGKNVKSNLELVLKKYDSYFISSRSKLLKEKTKDFFYSNFSNNKYKFIFSGEIYGGKSKAEICKEEGIHKMIEDNADYAFDCAKKGIITFLIDKPWNKNHRKHKNIIKVKDWKDLMSKLR
jgi:uncharacterized HAD superfamily protein